MNQNRRSFFNRRVLSQSIIQVWFSVSASSPAFEMYRNNKSFLSVYWIKNAQQFLDYRMKSILDYSESFFFSKLKIFDHYCPSWHRSLWILSMLWNSAQNSCYNPNFCFHSNKVSETIFDTLFPPSKNIFFAKKA